MQTPALSRYTLFSQGIFVDPMSPNGRLQALANKLHPQVSNFPLVRMGSNADGGYLVPDDLNQINACFSPGVDTFATFETDLLKRGIGSHLADYSVDKVPDGLEALSFTPKFVGANSIDHFISLQDWVEEYEPNSPNDSLLLQMDVEGAEYETILACPTNILSKFRIMVIEFHSIESWGHSDFLNIADASFSKILKTHFVVHSHPNNAMGLVDMNGFIAPRIFELTLLSRTRSAPGGLATTPHPLDYPNVSNMPNLNWNQCWVNSNSKSVDL
jgi:hypothetical protein